MYYSFQAYLTPATETRSPSLRFLPKVLFTWRFSILSVGNRHYFHPCLSPCLAPSSFRTFTAHKFILFDRLNTLNLYFIAIYRSQRSSTKTILSILVSSFHLCSYAILTHIFNSDKVQLFCSTWMNKIGLFYVVLKVIQSVWKSGTLSMRSHLQKQAVILGNHGFSTCHSLSSQGNYVDRSWIFATISLSTCRWHAWFSLSFTPRRQHHFYHLLTHK